MEPKTKGSISRGRPGSPSQPLKHVSHQAQQQQKQILQYQQKDKAVHGKVNKNTTQLESKENDDRVRDSLSSFRKSGKRNGQLYSSNMSRAVAHWTSSLDREIESNHVDKQFQTFTMIENRPLVPSSALSNNHKQRSACAQLNKSLSSQIESRPGAFGQQKLQKKQPLADLLQLDLISCQLQQPAEMIGVTAAASAASQWQGQTGGKSLQQLVQNRQQRLTLTPSLENCQIQQQISHHQQFPSQVGDNPPRILSTQQYLQQQAAVKKERSVLGERCLNRDMSEQEKAVISVATGQPNQRVHLKSSEGGRISAGFDLERAQSPAEAAFINKSDLHQQTSNNNLANCSMADFRTMQKNDHMAQAVASVLQQPLYSQQHGGKSNRINFEQKAQLGAQTPKSYTSKSIGSKIPSGGVSAGGMTPQTNYSLKMNPAAKRTGRSAINQHLSLAEQHKQAAELSNKQPGKAQRINDFLAAKEQQLRSGDGTTLLGTVKLGVSSGTARIISGSMDERRDGSIQQHNSSQAVESSRFKGANGPPSVGAGSTQKAPVTFVSQNQEFQSRTFFQLKMVTGTPSAQEQEQTQLMQPHLGTTQPQSSTPQRFSSPQAVVLTPNKAGGATKSGSRASGGPTQHHRVMITSAKSMPVDDNIMYKTQGPGKIRKESVLDVGSSLQQLGNPQQQQAALAVTRNDFKTHSQALSPNNSRPPQQKQVRSSSSTGFHHSKTASADSKTNKVQLKLFETGLDGNNVKNAVVPRLIMNNQQATPGVSSIPKSLRKMQQANHSMNGYLQQKSAHTTSEKTFSEKPNHTTMISDDQNGAGGSKQMHYQSLDDVSNPDDAAFMTQQRTTNYDYLRSLEVLEERSNEEHSPQIRQKKARGYLRRISSSPTNFINITSRKGSARSSARKSPTVVNFTQGITLTNQKDGQTSRKSSASLRKRKKVVQLRNSSQSTVKPRESSAEAEQSAWIEVKMVDTSAFVQMGLSIYDLELQQQMNSGGVFIASNRAGATPSAESSSMQQHAPQRTNAAPTWKQAHYQQQQQQQQSPFDSNHIGSNPYVDNNEATIQGRLALAPHQEQQIQQQRQLAPIQDASHHLQNQTPFRGVVATNGQQPPHLSQQAQQVLQQKAQIQPIAQRNKMRQGQNQQLLISPANIAATNSQLIEPKAYTMGNPPNNTRVMTNSEQLQSLVAARPNSNHRLIVPAKQLPSQQASHSAIAIQESAVMQQQEQPTSQSLDQERGQPQGVPTKQQPRTYKEIRKRLHQQQQMQYLRQQQQQWILKQQKILLNNNPGITIEQVNAIIQQSIINQQQQMALQQQQQQAVQQQAAVVISQTATATQASLQQSDQQIFPNGSLNSMQQQHQVQSLGTEEDEAQRLAQQKTPQVARVGKRQTGSVNNQSQGGGNMGQNNASASQQQVQIKQNINRNYQVGLAGASSNAPQSQLTNEANQHQLTTPAQKSHLQAASAQNLPAQSNKIVSPKDDTMMSYAQLLKQECQYDGGQARNYQPNSLQANLQPTNLPIENLKHTMQQLTSEILRKVLARSDGMNQLRQIIDLKAKKVKTKNYESAIFVSIMDKEQQRISQENQSLQKSSLRLEDKTLIKYVRNQVKKMLKPFRGLQYDDFLNNEIHLNEIMATQDQQNDPIKESRKRHLRILDAALREQVVDIQIVLGICVQISRQAFYNELNEYLVFAYDYIMANQSLFQSHDVQSLQNLKKKLWQVRSHSKVSIQTNKKLDRMFWLLFEQNQEVRNNIRTYKERYAEKTENGGVDAAQNAHTGSANHVARKQTNAIRSSSGIGTASPKVNAGGSSHNLFNQPSKGSEGSVRRTVTKGSRGSNMQQETYNGGGKQSIKSGVSTSQDTTEISSLHATTGGRAQQHLLKNAGKNSQLAPIQNSNGKKAQSLIQKKLKARDLDRQLNSQQNSTSHQQEHKTPEHHPIHKKRIASTKGNQQNPGGIAVSQLNSTMTSQTPQSFHPRSRTKQLNSGSSNYNQGLHGTTNQAGQPQLNNSTENLFNLIQATKTKNTMILEPLGGRSTMKRDSENPSDHMAQRDEMGSGLHGGTSSISQKSHRMRQTEYSRGFIPGQTTSDPVKDLETNNQQDPTSSSKVFRSWSRPQINDHNEISAQANIKTLQVCTCSKFRKRIDQPLGLDQQASAPKTGGQRFNEFSPSGRSSALDNSSQHSQVIKTEVKRGSVNGSDSVSSPSMRQNIPRMSQDFKMRILTKKKVAVPPSATSHQHSRQQFNQSHASSSSHERRKLEIPNRQISSDENVPVIERFPATEGKNSTLVKRSKIVTYELCQECGGQRPAGLPQVTSSLSEIKVKLNVHQVGQDGRNDDEEFPNTARLNYSHRSSTLSIGNRDDSQFLTQEKKTSGMIGSNVVNLSRVQADSTSSLLTQFQNRRYLLKLFGSRLSVVQDFVMDNRARKIQELFRDWHTERVLAVKIIQGKWRVHKRVKDSRQLRNAKIAHLRKKVAINRIYDLHRLIKVRKVTANSFLIHHQLCQQVAQSQDEYPDYIGQVVRIQRKWRAIISKRYLIGKALVAKKENRERIWDTVMRQKHRRTQCLESNLLYSETMFMREQNNLESYFWKQGKGYLKDLEMRAAKIEQRLSQEFALVDWQYESATRDWHNTNKSIVIKLQKNETSQVSVLRQKIVQYYLSCQLPSADAVQRQLEEYTNARTAMQKVLKKEQDYKKMQIVGRIKRQRLENLKRCKPEQQGELNGVERL